MSKYNLSKGKLSKGASEEVRKAFDKSCRYEPTIEKILDDTSLDLAHIIATKAQREYTEQNKIYDLVYKLVSVKDYIIRSGTKEEDIEESADGIMEMLVQDIFKCRIGYRVHDFEDWRGSKERGWFLRFSRSSGTPTEYHKWVDNKYPHLYFVGFTYQGFKILDFYNWLIFDPNHFVKLGLLNYAEQKKQTNDNGITYGSLYTVSELEPCTVIDQDYVNQVSVQLKLF